MSYVNNLVNKKTNKFSPCLHAKFLPLMTVTITLKIGLVSYCPTSLNEMDKMWLSHPIFFSHPKKHCSYLHYSAFLNVFVNVY